MVEHFKDWFGPVNYVISNSAIEAAFTVRDLIEEKKQHANDIIENRGIKNGKYVSLNGEDGMDYITDINDSIAYHMKAIASIDLMKPYSSDEGVINYDECKEGKITLEQLREIETKEIKRVAGVCVCSESLQSAHA